MSKVYLRVQSILYAGVLYMENTFIVVLHEKRYTKIKEYEQMYSYGSQTCDQNVSLCNVVLLCQYNRCIQLGFVSYQNNRVIVLCQYNRCIQLGFVSYQNNCVIVLCQYNRCMQLGFVSYQNNRVIVLCQYNRCIQLGFVSYQNNRVIVLCQYNRCI